MSKTNTQGRFLWQELVTTDTKSAIAFYGELFGWKATTMDMGGGGKYTIFLQGEARVGGMLPDEQAKGLPPHWNVYFSTRDTDKTIEVVKQAGGKVMAPAQNVPGVGRFAVLLDPQGTSFSVLTPEEERADTDEKVPSGHFCWVEGLVGDPPSAVSFYAKVFGWSSTEVDVGPAGKYHRQNREGGKMAGGIAKKPMAEAPNAWLSYVAVDDVDATVKRAARLKGVVLAPAQDIPNVGRFAVLQDPTGAAFAVFKAA